MECLCRGRALRDSAPLFVWKICLAVSLVLAVLPAALAAAAPSETVLVSRATGSDGSPAHNSSGLPASSRHPSSSDTGRYIAFESDANNLSDEDVDGITDIFVRDLQTATTTLVSRADGPSGDAGASASTAPSISADGRYIAFRSDADNLSSADDNSKANVFLRDVLSGTTKLVSRADGAMGAGADGDSFEPSISADGKHVAFASDAANLSIVDNNSVRNVFVRDVQADTTTLVSRRDGGLGADLDGGSGAPSVSADGRYIAFDSYANNLSDIDTDGFKDVFVRDTQLNTNIFVSKVSGVATGGSDSSYDPSISGDGRYVAFDSQADNLSTDDVDAWYNVFLRDTQTNTTVLVSRAEGASGAGAIGDSNFASISANGQYVAFSSDARNLSGDDRDDFASVFVRDTVNNLTALVSRQSGVNGPGATGGGSLRASISGDANYVAFASDADDLSDVDDNEASNIFARNLRLPAPRIVEKPNPDKTAPTLFTKAARKVSARALAKAKRAGLTISCNEACSIAADASVVFSRKRGRRRAKKQAVKLTTQNATASANQPKQLTFKLSKSLLKRLSKATRPPSKAAKRTKTVQSTSLVFLVTVKDSAGNKSKPRTIKVKITR